MIYAMVLIRVAEKETRMIWCRIEKQYPVLTAGAIGSRWLYLIVYDYISWIFIYYTVGCTTSDRLIKIIGIDICFHLL